MKNTYASLRTHIILPVELIVALDNAIGKRKRSSFIAAAALEKLDRLRLLENAQKASGALKNKNIPEWETAKSARIWVKKLRTENNFRTKV